MKSNWTYFAPLLLILTLAIAMGCSGNKPGFFNVDEKAPAMGNTHYLWGLWQFTADPAEGTLDVVQLRSGDFHLNTIVFLEPPALVNLTLESLKFVGNIIEADIGLRHPFIGLTEFTGFDVCGILITNGSAAGFTDAALRMAGKGDTRLLNPDGLTRWWNPAEFPVNTKTIYGYNDGLLGTPDGVANYNSTLNAYKYFCDDIAANDPMSNVPLAKRGLFSAGKKNIRHYTIDMGTGLVFNYAVDASWQFPTGSAPWVVPDDFGPGATKIEAWRAAINEISNSLYNDGASSGGELHFKVNLYDWFNAGLNILRVESPGNFAPVGPIAPSGGGAGYSTYQIDITSATPQTAGSIDVLIIAECEASGYGGLLPGKAEAAYFLYKPAVSSMGGLVCDLKVVTPMPYQGWIAVIEFDASGSYDPGGASLTFEWDFNNDGIFGDTFEYGTSAKPGKCFGTNYAGNVCVRVSNGLTQVVCCKPVDITILPSKNIKLRDVEAYDIAIDHADGDLFVLYADGQVWKYALAGWYQEGAGAKFADLKTQCTSQDFSGLKYMDIAGNSVVCITGKGNTVGNRIIFFAGDGTYIYGCGMAIGSDSSIFDSTAFVNNGGTHGNSAGYARGRVWSGTIYNEMCYHMPTDYSVWHWNINSYTDTGVYTGQSRIYYVYAVAVETDQAADKLWWIENTDFYASRWRLEMNASNPTYSYMYYDNAWFGTGSKSDDNTCWNDARDITRDNKNRYFVLDKLSGGQPKVKIFDVTTNPGVAKGGFGDSTTISGDPRRAEGSNYDGYVVVMHGATVPQMISIFTKCEMPG